jgi:hypothetical protein
MIENKNRGPLPSRGAGSRGSFCFHFSFAASPGVVKGSALISVGDGGLTGFAPLGAVFDDPVREGAFKPDVMAGLFRLDPLVPEDFLAFRLEFAVERGVLEQIIRRR